MPGKVKVKILAGRNLPVMDRSSDTTDAYVEIKFGNTTYKTDVCRKSLNPQWNSEWYRFEVDEAELQDEPLQIRLMDHDTYSANDAIGKVYLDLNPLLLPGTPPPVKNMWTLEASMSSSTGSQGGSVMTGWIPVYDTMHGIRGEVNVIVKVELFSDFNKFRQSSCGVQFFCSPIIPHGYHAQAIHGFVEELVVNDDPEYKWIDKIRTPRASNEARQTLFFKLSGEVQRKIGLKALDLGGNAVIGYHQCFDLEGESGIVARGVGTAASLVKMHETSTVPLESLTSEELALLGFPSKLSTSSSEIDETDPLLPQTSRALVVSPSFLRSTRISGKFPGYGDSLKKRSTPLTMVDNYRSAGSSVEMSRRMPKRHLRRVDAVDWPDENVEELSLRSILAQEDMRGETGGNRFSRGLKSLGYLPRNMISRRVNRLRARFSDSFDEESDLDSSFSSAWSIDSIKSGKSVQSLSSFASSDVSIMGRKKKFNQKRNVGDGMAALLIRSVHSGLALDIVNEDHESPVPSPVKSFSDAPISDDSDAKSGDFSVKSVEEIGDSDGMKNVEEVVQVAHLASASETSSDSEGSASDDPSESNADYNVFANSSPIPEADLRTIDSLDQPVARTAVESSSSESIFVEEKSDDFYYQNTEEIGKKIVSKASQSETSDTVSSSICSSDSEIWFDKQNSSEEADLVSTEDADRYSPTSSIADPDSPSRSKDSSPIPDDVASTKCSDRYDTDNGGIPIASSMTATKTEFLERSENIDGPADSRPAAASTPTESDEIKEFFRDADYAEIGSKTTNLRRSISLNDRVIRKLLTSSKIRLKPKSESFKSEAKQRLNIFKTLNISRKHLPTVDDKSATDFRPDSTKSFPLCEMTRKQPVVSTNTKSRVTDSANRSRPQKSARKVTRNETVIYRGPLLDESQRVDNSKKVATIEKSVPIFKPDTVPQTARIVGTDHCHLSVPVVEVTDVNAASHFREEEFSADFRADFSPEPRAGGSNSLLQDESKYFEKLERNKKQRRMLDLLRVIDTKMLVQPVRYEHKDSTRSRRRRRDGANASSTPSPVSIRNLRSAKRKSRSPEGSLRGRAIGNSSSIPVQKTQPANLDTNDFPATIDTNRHESLTKDEKPIFSILNSPELETSKRALSTSESSMSFHRGSNLPGHEVTVMQPDTKSLNLTNPPASEYNAEAENLARIVPPNITNASNKTDHTCVPCDPTPIRQTDTTSSIRPSSPTPQASPISASLAGNKVAKSPKNNSAVPIHRRSSDSDLSITPKGNSLTGSDRSSMGGYLRPATGVVRPMNQEALDMLEYPFITMQQYPPGFILHLGGTVSARSVKLLERISNIEEPESRDAWWTEIRMEVRSHARALACNVVLGYREETSICDDVCVLSASGTAAVINLQNPVQELEGVIAVRPHQRETTTTAPLERTEFENEKGQQPKVATVKIEKCEKNEKPPEKSEKCEKHEKNDKNEEAVARDQRNGCPATKVTKQTTDATERQSTYTAGTSSCAACHIPYSENSVPFRVNMLKCALCRRGKVPDVLLTTIELPENIPITGRGCVVQATVCRPKRDLRGELNAKEISDGLPFLEYELHSLLLNKIKVKSMNALFGLRVQVSIGEKLLVGMATGTAVYLSPLPTPAIPKVTSGNSWSDDQKLADIQKSIVEAVKKNREFYQLKSLSEMENGRPQTSDDDESEDEMPEIDLGAGNKDACILEVDDMEDVDRISMLMDSRPPEGFHVVNTQTIPGLEDLEIVRNLQMFTQLWRAKIPVGQPAAISTKYFGRLLQSVYFKLRKMVPCALCDLQFKVDLPEPDEIQLSVVGMALGLGEPAKLTKYKRKVIPRSGSRDQVKKSEDSDLIFSLDEDHVVPENNTTTGSLGAPSSANVSALHSVVSAASTQQRTRPKSPLRTKLHALHKHRHVPLKERYGVDITPLSYMPGGKIDRYLGNLNFFFIRESTAIREAGGLSGFVHSFVTEVLAIVRAHVTALGGNAMVAYFMTECVLCHSPHKNQGQCLINVGGDVVSVSYFGDDKHAPGTANV